MTDKPRAGQPIWRRPLVHFLLAGAVIFAFNAYRGEPDGAGSRHIVVTVATVERLAGLWQKTWGRPPSENELQALVRDHIREEVYYREALQLGLDVNDTVIRRRLRQKMEFLTTDDLASGTVDDDVLTTWFEKNAERYRLSPVLDFTQIYFSAANVTGVEDALVALRSGANENSFGEAISLPRRMTRADEASIAREFGSAFYDAVTRLETGIWSDPVESGFGQHIVRVSHKDAARIPSLDDIRNMVRNDWLAEQTAASREAAYEQLRARYAIEIEVPAE